MRTNKQLFKSFKLNIYCYQFKTPNLPYLLVEVFQFMCQQNYEKQH